MKMRLSLFALLIWLAASSLGLAQDFPKVSALRAYEQAKSGDWYLVDIRTRSEWAQGVAEGASLISMHEPGFLQKLMTLTGGDKQAKIALICATGGRTNFLQPELRKRGWTQVYDVSEGMFGSSAGPGWIKRDLPVVKPQP